MSRGTTPLPAPRGTADPARRPRWPVPADITKPPLSGAAHWIGVPLLRSFWRIRSLGTHHVPLGGPVILAGNHTNFADGPLLYAFSPRPVHFWIKQEMFTGVLDPVLRGIGHIPVSRGSADRGMIMSSLKVLQAGNALGVFPEGTRGAGDFAEVHNGLAYLAMRSGAPIVPVACLGTGERGASIGSLPAFRAKIDVVYGKPFLPAPDTGKRSRRAVTDASERIVERLTAHLHEAERLTGRAAKVPAGADARA
ncbi:lysophospholipid acyltransferase family protein [Yinghuangia seranimata]|uniref:lysophospholipid acyltransferase family protein n=1 Tax=Yinghuangia seranimata TaxID=408067 RepID=UPI00248C5A50|nr:lysophospholipid acyltransferase family protein [Yinghuangia seranimata]MDI2131811.1 lysophospholipid acyltransferase family protein [Yinghuangia seranimata]